MERFKPTEKEIYSSSENEEQPTPPSKKETNEKKSSALKKRWESDSKFRESRRIFHQVQTNEIQEEIKTALGEDIARKLYELHHIQQLTIEDIATDTGLQPWKIINLMKEYNITRILHTYAPTVQAYQDVQQALWSRPELISTLSEKQKTIINRRFLSDGQIPSLKEVGEELGKTKNGIQMTERKAIKKLTNK